MRRRLVLSTIAIVLVVLAALAVPVGIIVYQSAETELRDRIEDDATSIANALTDEFVAGGEPVGPGASPPASVLVSPRVGYPFPRPT